MRILFVGDVFARPGRKVLYEQLAEIKDNYLVDFCIANGENAAGGKGISQRVADELYEAGVDVITLGNHAWDNRDVLSFIDTDPRIVRALNYPPGVPGHGLSTASIGNGKNIVVAQVCCRLFMTSLDCPFRAVDQLLSQIKNNSIVIVDMHGEATSEKMALAWYLDGRIAALIGTHTHIPTADERILPGGTAYITDIGMTGAYDSIIGMDIETSVQRFLTGMKTPFRIAKKNVKLSAVLITLNDQTGKAESIERILSPSGFDRSGES